MRWTASNLPLALLFLASIVPSRGQSSEPTTVVSPAAAAAADELPETADIVHYDIRGNFSLDCSSLVTDRSVDLSWSKNGTRLEEVAEYQRGHLVLLPTAGGLQRALLTLSGRALETDFGNYTCSLGAGAGLRDGDAASTKAWSVRARTHVKLPSDSNVVEGQKLKLTCKLLGRPYPAVAWSFSNSTETENASFVPVEEALGARATVKESDQHVVGAELVVDPAARQDAGLYRCQVVTPTGAGGAFAVTRLRVKDMYAALWPFLGICAEVFVLCAIILVYEKRRTKPELDDSDTDNHDQKKS